MIDQPLTSDLVFVVLDGSARGAGSAGVSLSSGIITKRHRRRRPLDLNTTRPVDWARTPLCRPPGLPFSRRAVNRYWALNDQEPPQAVARPRDDPGGVGRTAPHGPARLTGRSLGIEIGN